MPKTFFSSRFGPTRFDYLEPEKIRSIQEKKLRAVVQNAYRNTRFWRDWLDAAKVRPEEINRLEDLWKLPLCTKKDLLARALGDRLTVDPGKCVKMSTSGTTGGPMDVYYSKHFFRHLYYHGILRRRNRVRPKIGVFAKQLQISFQNSTPQPHKTDGDFASASSGSPSENHPHARRNQALGGGSAILGPLFTHIRHRCYFSSEIEEVVPELRDFEADEIDGNPSYLRLLADYVRTKKGAGIHPKKVGQIGEPADEPNRRYIETSLGCPAYEGYGCNELGLISTDCSEKNGMHIFSDSYIVEVLDRQGLPVPAGVGGEIVVTGLENDAMPLIRYKLGDLGLMSVEDGPCPCGVTLPKIGSVEGRTIDHIKTANGQLISPKRVLTLMHSVDTLPRCQLIQESVDSFRLRVFPGLEEDAAAVDDFLKLLRAEIPARVQIDVSKEEPDKMKAKFRAVMSNVSLEDAGKKLVQVQLREQIAG